MFCFAFLKLEFETNSPLLLYAENQGNRSVFYLVKIYGNGGYKVIDSESFVNLMSYGQNNSVLSVK
jgi:hypothetical protein